MIANHCRQCYYWLTRLGVGSACHSKIPHPVAWMGYFFCYRLRLSSHLMMRSAITVAATAKTKVKSWSGIYAHHLLPQVATRPCYHTTRGAVKGRAPSRLAPALDGLAPLKLPVSPLQYCPRPHAPPRGGLISFSFYYI